MKPIFPEHWKVLITGITSIHGWPIFQKFSFMLDEKHLFGVRPPKMTMPQGKNVVSLCITDINGFYSIKKIFQPTHIIHCSGVCDLDVCEERPEWAARLNEGGTRAVAKVFGNDCHIMYMSTDLVFSGTNPPAGGYTEDAIPDPVNVAGRTFLAAENALSNLKQCCTIRLGLPLGCSITGNKGAFDWVESRFKKGLPVTLFHDEFRSCISCEEIAEVAVKMLHMETAGLFHFGGTTPVSLSNIGQMVLKKGAYPEHLLSSISRFEEKNGPPRIGNVALDSGKIKAIL